MLAPVTIVLIHTDLCFEFLLQLWPGTPKMKNIHLECLRLATFQDTKEKTKQFLTEAGPTGSPGDTRPCTSSPCKTTKEALRVEASKFFLQSGKTRLELVGSYSRLYHLSVILRGK